MNQDYIHNKAPSHLTREELLDLVNWYEKALKGMTATIRMLDAALKDVPETNFGNMQAK